MCHVGLMMDMTTQALGKGRNTADKSRGLSVAYGGAGVDLHLSEHRQRRAPAQESYLQCTVLFVGVTHAQVELVALLTLLMWQSNGSLQVSRTVPRSFSSTQTYFNKAFFSDTAPWASVQT